MPDLFVEANVLPGLAQTVILPNSAFSVADLTGVSHHNWLLLLESTISHAFFPSSPQTTFLPLF
jgi:hypothetical protein